MKRLLVEQVSLASLQKNVRFTFFWFREIFKIDFATKTQELRVTCVCCQQLHTARLLSDKMQAT